jgi:hypothetical protein
MAIEAQIPTLLGSQELIGVRCTVMRGGTSKAVFLPAEVVPESESDRKRFLLALMGSPDPRQIDGLGGADLLTTKVAIIGGPTRKDADLDYTFAQVSVTRPEVYFDMNCGNISSAVGVYALEKGLIPAQEPLTRIRIHNRNTHTILLSDVPVKGNHALIEGDCMVDGVPGTGAGVKMDYHLTAGGATRSLLPTGHAQDLIAVKGWGEFRISVVDIANVGFMVSAEDVGLDPSKLPKVPDQELLRKMDAIQRAVARNLGMAEGQLTPIPVIVAPPHDFATVVGGIAIKGHQVDIVSEVIGGQPLTLHKAFPGTTSVTLAVAAKIPGTVAYELTRKEDTHSVRIGHPSGQMEVGVRVSFSDEGFPVVEEASYLRTARLLMDGITYLRRSRL